MEPDEGRPKALCNPGRFNLGELGMKHMLSYLPGLARGVPVHFAPFGDFFDFIV